MNREKYGYDYADDVKMWELVSFDETSEEWECMGIYTEDEGQANALANMLENYFRLRKGN